jgi:tetratricopeptide (TPR) repeat protein
MILLARIAGAMHFISLVILLTHLLASTQSNQAEIKQRAAFLFEQGQNAQERGDLVSAIKFYTGAIEADPQLFQAYYQRGVALAAMGKASEAEADFKKAIELEPSFARGHRALGQLLLDRGMTEAAKAELARAIELDGKLTGVRLYYASALIKSGEAARAIEQLRAAIEIGEATALTYALLGVAEERLGKTQAAFADYARAIELNPNEPIAREGRARLFEARGEFSKAIEDYTVFYRAQPSSEAALKLARLHALAGQLQAAISIYRRLLAEKPEDFALWSELVRLMMEAGQLDEAAREIEASLRLHPRDVKRLMFAGDLYLKDKPEVAANYYRRAVEVDPAEVAAQIALGASLVRSKQFADAVAVLNQALMRDPDNFQAHANLATAMFELKQYQQAASQFLWLIRARPELAVAYYFLAISLDRLGQCQQALGAYREFVRRADPTSNKREIEDAGIRLSLLEKLAKEGRCRSAIKGREK